MLLEHTQIHYEIRWNAASMVLRGECIHRAESDPSMRNDSPLTEHAVWYGVWWPSEC